MKEQCNELGEKLEHHLSQRESSEKLFIIYWPVS
ncbi:MAG: hypothetical protein QOJ02_922 [Acidobacteriota bacterium]|jgi:hypothetical protein|nr:hypothetical protein [Acidobacteriota bacterium]